MKIVIMVHSQSGTTMEFAERIAVKLKEKYQVVHLTKLETDPPIKSGSVRHTAPFNITNLPDIKEYDIILIGGPVWAFSASPIVVAAIEKLGNLSGKKVIPFVTMGFFHPSLGGNKAISLLGQKASAVGATVLPGKIIPKLFHDYKALFEKEATEIAKLV